MFKRQKRLSMDAIMIPDEAVEEFVRFLKVKLEPEDFAELKQMIGQNQQSDDDEPDMTMDQPPDFKNKPKPGGSMVAADARGQSYEDRFPDAARIAVWL
jgi:hypothetical protein